MELLQSLHDSVYEQAQDWYTRLNTRLREQISRQYGTMPDKDDNIQVHRHTRTLPITYPFQTSTHLVSKIPYLPISLLSLPVSLSLLFITLSLSIRPPTTVQRGVGGCCQFSSWTLPTRPLCCLCPPSKIAWDTCASFWSTSPRAREEEEYKGDREIQRYLVSDANSVPYTEENIYRLDNVNHTQYRNTHKHTSTNISHIHTH